MGLRGRGQEHPALRRGLRVDRVGTEAVVLDPVAALVHRLTGPAAEVMAELVLRGRDVADLPARLAPAVAGLRQAGVLRGEVSRRQALGTAAVGAVGIMTLALPSAATAASPAASGGGGAIADVSQTGLLNTLPSWATAASGYTYRTFNDPDAANRFDVQGSGTLTIDVLIVGAGGRGGLGPSGAYAEQFPQSTGDLGYGAGGGGAGGSVSLVLARETVDGDQLAVTVGKGGGRGGSTGDDGGTSGFELVTATGGLRGAAGSAAAPAARGGDSRAGGASSAHIGGSGAIFESSTGAGDQRFGGGGGGAGGDGLDADLPNLRPGAGGPGFEVSAFFAATTRFGTGGSGFGPYGSPDPGSGGGAAMTDGSYGGGGGGGSYPFPGNGGNGVVIVRYPT